MGKYISSETLRRRVGSARYAALCGSDDAATVAEEVVSRAEALVEGYAATRYALPLQTCDLLGELVLRVAEFELYKRGAGESVPGKIKDSYEDALKRLAELSSGVMLLPSQSPANAAGISVSVSNTARETRFDASQSGSF
jgi:phage gp36-like protein